jgi:hypothetical protein
MIIFEFIASIFFIYALGVMIAGMTFTGAAEEIFNIDLFICLFLWPFTLLALLVYAICIFVVGVVKKFKEI